MDISRIDLASLQNFQFAEPVWLWGLLLLPVIWILYALLYRPKDGRADLGDFADPHLLPHLIGGGTEKAGRKRRIWLSLFAWSLFWSMGLLAMAGPRWDYTEVKAFSPARDLVLLLDLSRSMDAQDVKPSRLARARQEIEDINRLGEGVNIALIAFASVPHVITPLTDDRETLNKLLPSLETGLVYTQGSSLAPALKRAGEMLSAEPGNEKHILVISDGGFEDGDAAIYRVEQELLDQGVRVHTMGMGTAQGAPVPSDRGYFKKDGKAVISRLDENALRRIARDGKGLYLESSYLENDTQALLSRINVAAADTQEKTARFWEERFYIFLLPLAFLLLPWFRRNAAFPLVLAACFVLPAAQAHAFEWQDLFLNKAQQGKAAIEKQQYEEAIGKFDDPYRRGVAQYKAGQYDQAIKSFRQAQEAAKETDAEYNLGNAQLMTGKIKEAIASYEDVLKADPGHEDAAHNLEIAKKLLQQQQQQKQNRQDKQDDQGQQSRQQGDEGASPQDNTKDADQGGQGSQQQAENEDQNQQGTEQQSEEQNGQGGDQQEDGKQAETGAQDESGQAANDRRQDESAGEQEGEHQEQPEKQPEQQAQAGDNGEEGQQPQGQDSGQQAENPPGLDQSGTPKKSNRTPKDVNADQWLSRIENDPEEFLKNKFYIESKRQQARQGENPW